MKYGFFLLLATLALCTATAGVKDIAPGKYGKITPFTKDEVIVYPDFTVRFLGTRTVESTTGAQSFVYWDFEIDSSGAKTQVSWKRSTGATVPAYFDVQGAPYVMELRTTVASKKVLKDNQFVIWPKTDYLKIASRGLLK
ncbi:MAG: hypothetical protein ABI615_10440 [Chthoniobacterales bacterium]